MICGVTESGLKYAVKKAGNAVGYCALSIKCGTRNEASFSSGIAHFIEHTIFKGTQKKTAHTINNFLDCTGGELNAFTTKEEIVLHATILKNDLGKASNLLLELATSATFPEKEINIEKGVVSDEIQSYKDSPSEEIYDMFEELFFANHPLSKPILGNENSVKKITSGELKKFSAEKFRPEQMAFTVICDKPEKEMERFILKLTDKYFPRDKSTNHKTDIQPAEAEYYSPVPAIFDKTEDKNNFEANTIMGALAPSMYDEKGRLGTILLCNILGGPASNSILNKTLREKKGWVYNVECSYSQYSDCGLVSISLGCDKANLDKCKRAIYKEIEKLQKTPISERSFNAAKKQLYGQMTIASDNLESQCLSMGKSLISFGNIPKDNEIKNKIEQLKPEDIQNLAIKIFDKEKISVLTYL